MSETAIEPGHREYLNDRQKLFVARYLESMNASQAAIDVGYSASNAIQLMRHPAVKKAIDEAITESGMKPGEIIARLTRLARGSTEDIYDIDESGYARPNLAKAKKAGKMDLVADISHDNNGMLKVKMQSQLDAIEKLAKIHAMFSERIEINVSGQVDIQVNKQVMIKALADPALLAKLGELAEQVASKGNVQAQLPAVEVVGEVLPTDDSV